AKASKSGSPMTTQTNDCSSCDFRIAKVPQKTHAAGSQRDVVLVSQVYPRYGNLLNIQRFTILTISALVGTGRGAPEYFKENQQNNFFNWTETKGIGQIPQVATTYGYIEGVYPLINEHQLAIGESTCGANLWAKPATQGGKALFDITELARVAFERTKTAREAVQLMGDLAVQYGYYGAEWEGDAVYSEAGETLTVTDTKEGWVFHILPDDSGASAVWVAQRVPDTHIVAIGNQFIIHHVNLTDSDNFLGSSNLYDVAKRNNFWDGQSNFDFTVAYARRRPGESFYYSTRRQWRVYTLANPRLDLSPYTDAFGTTYPFSVETAGLLDASDLIRFQRDHYENTTFDLTQGPQSGPYGNPDRYSKPASFVAQQEVQATAVSILAREGEAALVAHLTAASNKFATSAHEAFYALFVDVVTRFHDGSIFSDFASESMTVSAMGYPSWWLEEVGYFGPKAANGVAVTGALVLGVVTVVALAVGLGFWLGRRTSTVKSKGYVLVK
ncbi:hypothetical protein DYB28_011853, partial [Aphanomyces astaci]